MNIDGDYCCVIILKLVEFLYQKQLLSCPAQDSPSEMRHATNVISSCHMDSVCKLVYSVHWCCYYQTADQVADQEAQVDLCMAIRWQMVGMKVSLSLDV